MTRKDAAFFPLIGSATLLSLYLAYKYFGPWLLNVLFSSYVSLVGVCAFGVLLHSTFPDTKLIGKLVFPGVFARIFGFESMNVTFSGICVSAVSAAVGVGYFSSRHFLIHNILAISVSIQAIVSISLGSVTVGLMLLWGLFVYDVFWVFGTDVMVTVAKNFDGPIKLILPLSFDPWKNGILGLGDIVIPGLLIALCLRFDRKQGSNIFWAAYCAYAVGLLMTGLVMAVFNAPQPALLYLVPAVTGSAVAAAYRAGILREFFAYDEEKKTL